MTLTYFGTDSKSRYNFLFTFTNLTVENVKNISFRKMRQNTNLKYNTYKYLQKYLIK